MGLRIKSTRQFGHKIATLMAVFALVAQPMYGLVASQLASAASHVVQPDTQGWAAPPDVAKPEFVTGPAGVSGQGSMKLSTVTDPKQAYFRGDNVPLGQINGMAYTSKVENGVPVSYQLYVNGATGTNGQPTWTYLVWEPANNGLPNGPSTGQFEPHNGLESGNWWSSQPIAGAPNRDTFVPFASLVALHQDAVVNGVGVNVGSGTPNAVSYVDTLSYQGNTYDFEPTPAPEVIASGRFTHCDAFSVSVKNAVGKKLRIDWSNGYHTETITQADRYWWSGHRKLSDSVSYKVTEGNQTLASGTFTNSADCTNHGYWSKDGKTFGLKKMGQYPNDYNVIINWQENGTAQTTTKKMSETKQSGWWSGGDRSSVLSFSYRITNAQNQGVYTSPVYYAPSAVPTGLKWTAPAVACGGTTNSYNITATWNDEPRAAYYEYRVKTPKHADPWQDPNRITTNSREGDFNQGEGTYAYQVRSFNADGVPSEWSAECSVVYDETDPVDPVDPIDPVDPVDPTDPVDPPTDPVDPVDPPTDPADPSPGPTPNPEPTSEPTPEPRPTDSTGNPDDNDEPQTDGLPVSTAFLAMLDAQAAESNAAEEEEEEGEVLADEDNAQANNTENGEVLADEDAADEGCAKFLGLCWYWWIPIVGAVLVVGWILRGMLREDDELPTRRQ